jgi:thiamine kinase
MEAMVEQLSPAKRRQLEQLCANYRDWACGESYAPAVAQLFPGGYSNTVVLLVGATQRWVLRLAGDAERPGVSRERELTVHGIAAQAGLAPSIRYADPDCGTLIMDYVDGQQETYTDPRRLADYLRNLHTLSAPGPALHSPDLLRGYFDDTASRSALPSLGNRHEALLGRALAILDEANARPTLCHNDLLAANRIRVGETLLGVDWEYASPGDPFFDIAVCASELQSGEAAQLLTHYLGRDPQTDENRRFNAQLLIYRCIEAFWFVRHAPTTAAARKALLKLEAQLEAARATAGLL